VVLDASDLGDDEMQAIAREVGFSETAFLSPIGERQFRIRYFAPQAEVDFCGHATIAAGVALGERLGEGAFPLTCNVGHVGLVVKGTPAGFLATLESPPASAEPLSPDLLDQVLQSLGWDARDLHPDLPPMIGTAGTRHPVLVVDTLRRLAHLDYDFPALQALCRREGWPTLQLITPDGPGQWRARNPFPFGGVVEDPATGAAAAAFGGYLRTIGRATAGDRFVIRQGIEMGRPSVIDVEVGARSVFVSGAATRFTH
jgi:PhzF family phenazine biosynthesis protein